ncbi:AAA family ATPase [Desnuesiella massiliensis]|uniref:AAA family ATPase n=1 Tax=Desnuesiella massiliensis TaxID=1650662 RepID=UPI0006E2DCC6|nr:AAA family ATPase [Desnuesiella massiliensis]
MKKLIFIHGPNGVGKSTICKVLHHKLLNSAWLESEWCRNTNPFIFSAEIELMVEKNITFLIRNYFECSMIDYVIFNWGFHGPRKKIFHKVLKNLSDLKFELVPITITCSEEENIKRMKQDGRDEERIKRILDTRYLYEGPSNPTIDSTFLTVEGTVNRILDILEN